MFDEFRWTSISEKRNDLTRMYEPIQIDLLRSLSRLCSRARYSSTSVLTSASIQ